MEQKEIIDLWEERIDTAIEALTDIREQLPVPRYHGDTLHSEMNSALSKCRIVRQGLKNSRQAL